MKVRYFSDTDTLLIEFRSIPAAETRDFDANTILDVDAHETSAQLRLSTHLSGRTHPISRTRKSPPNSTGVPGLRFAEPIGVPTIRRSRQPPSGRNASPVNYCHY